MINNETRRQRTPPPPTRLPGIGAPNGRVPADAPREAGDSGKADGHARVNVDAVYAMGGWTLCSRVDNLFDHEHATAGALASNPFDAAGASPTDGNAWRDEQFVAPGTPRAAFVGRRAIAGEDRC